MKNGTEITLTMSSNMIGDSKDGANFPNKLLLIDAQVSRVCKAFGNGSSADIKFSKP